MSKARTIKSSIRQSQAERDLLEAIGHSRGFKNYSSFLRAILGAYVVSLDMAQRAQQQGVA